MNLLIVAATPPEIAPLVRYLDPYRVGGAPESYKRANLEIRFCLTGVGGVAAAYNLTKALSANAPDVAIQAGIAGCFHPAAALGDLYRVEAERFADLGAEDDGQFLDLFALGLQDPDTPPFLDGTLPAPELPYPLLRALPAVSAVTVNTVSGHGATIERLTEKYHPGLESMEGAAFHYVCLQENVTFAQIRAVSNHVTVRDKARWNIPLAVERLNTLLIRFIDAL